MDQCLQVMIEADKPAQRAYCCTIRIKFFYTHPIFIVCLAKIAEMVIEA